MTFAPRCNTMSNHTARIWGLGGYFSQIFRSSVNDGVPFYPLYYNQFLNRKLPVIIDTNNLMLVLVSVPGLRTIIDKKNELLMNACFKVVDEDVDVSRDEEYKEYPDDPVYQLIHNPNPLQTHNEFIQQWGTMRDVYATSLIYKRKAARNSFPKSLTVLPSGEMKIEPTGLLFDQTKIEQIIKEYIWINTQQPNAQPRAFQPSDVMRYIDGPTDRYYFGISKLITNKLMISNLQQSLSTRNVLITDMGARGILSNRSPDLKPLGKKEQNDIEKDYRHEYGNGEDQKKILITNSNLEWQPITVPVQELMVFEEVESCYSMLCDIFGLQRGIFSESSVSKPAPIGGDGKGKVEEALKITYETTIQQTANEFCRGFNQDPDFGLKERKRKLVACFDHLPVMQEDQVDAENVNSVRKNAAAVQTTSLLALNTAVSMGLIELDAAISIAVNIHCIPEEIASTIILKPKKIIAPPSDENMSDEKKKFIEFFLKPITVSHEA